MKTYEIIGFIFISVIRASLPILFGLSIGFGWYTGLIITLGVATFLNALVAYGDAYHYKKSYGG